MTAEEYRSQLQALLPSGAAWPREPGAILTKTLHAVADELARVDVRADDLLTESDPRSTFELLGDWERAFGLPAACVPAGQTTTERRSALAAKVAALGGQSRAYFLELANAIGYVGATWSDIAWQFINSAQGWTPANATVTPQATTILYASTAANPSLTKTGQAFKGLDYRYVIARLRRTVTASEVWDGIVTYATSGHAASASYHKAIAEPAGIGSDYVLATWDMHALTAGGTDWRDSIITALTLELGQSTGNTYEIDWIALSKTPTVDVAITIDEQVDGLPHRWRINAPTNTVTEFTCNSPCTDPLRDWGNELLECVMNRYKPAHSELLFGYS